MKAKTFIVVAGIMLSCSGTQKKFSSPPEYNLNNPEIFKMPETLVEISGHTFYQGDPSLIYAEQDEEGAVYTLKLGKDPEVVRKSVFGKDGDFEDIAILGDWVVMLRSDGVFFSFPFSELQNEEIPDAKKTKDLIPKGEYEGLFADNQSGLLYVLCKNCPEDKKTQILSGYVLKMNAANDLEFVKNFEINLEPVKKAAHEKKFKFRPSALAKNPQTGDWFILSSVNKMLVITDTNWKVKKIYPLNPKIYIQPEGIAFDKNLNLYLSSEGDATTLGRIFKIPYNPQK